MKPFLGRSKLKIQMPNEGQDPTVGTYCLSVVEGQRNAVVCPSMRSALGGPYSGNKLVCLSFEPALPAGRLCHLSLRGLM